MYLEPVSVEEGLAKYTSDGIYQIKGHGLSFFTERN
jgi:hypothetical protein